MLCLKRPFVLFTTWAEKKRTPVFKGEIIMKLEETAAAGAGLGRYVAGRRLQRRMAQILSNDLQRGSEVERTTSKRVPQPVR